MYDDSKSALCKIEPVSEGIAESSSIYEQGYSDSNMSFLLAQPASLRTKGRKRAGFNDSNAIREVYHIRVSGNKPIDIGFDIRNVHITKKGNDLELFLPHGIQVIVCEYFRNLESLPNIVFAGTIILTGEEFLYVFAHTLYLWYRRVTKHNGLHIQHSMGNIVEKAKEIKKIMGYQAVREEIAESQFWNSLRVVDDTHAMGTRAGECMYSIKEGSQTEQTIHVPDNGSVVTSDVTLLPHNKTYTDNVELASGIRNEISLLREEIEEIEQRIQVLFSKSDMVSSKEEHIYERIHTVEQAIYHLTNTVDSIHTMMRSLQDGSSNIFRAEIEEMRKQLGTMQHTIATLHTEMRAEQTQYKKDSLQSMLQSYTQLICNELHSLRSYIDTVEYSDKDVSKQHASCAMKKKIHNAKRYIDESFAKITSMQESITEQKESIHTNFVPLYSELNAIKASLQECEQMLGDIQQGQSNEVQEYSASSQSHVIEEEVNTLEEQIRKLTEHLMTVEGKVHELFNTVSHEHHISTQSNQSYPISSAIDSASDTTILNSNSSIESLQQYSDDIPSQRSDMVEDSNGVDGHLYDGEREKHTVDTRIHQEDEQTQILYSMLQSMQRDIEGLSTHMQSMLASNESHHLQYTSVSNRVDEIAREIGEIHEKIAHVEDINNAYSTEQIPSVTDGLRNEIAEHAQYINTYAEDSHETHTTRAHHNDVESLPEMGYEDNEDVDKNVSPIGVDEIPTETMTSHEEGQYDTPQQECASVTSVYDAITDIQNSLAELQSSVIGMRQELHSVNENQQEHAIISAESLQTWIQYLQGLPEEFTRNITVLGIQYNGIEHVIDSQFETVYGTMFLSHSGEIHYTPHDNITYPDNISYSDEFVCTIRNEENLYLSITFSFSLSLHHAIIYAVMQPLINYVYLYSEQGLSVDIQIRNPAIGDRLYTDSVQAGKYHYTVCTQSHCTIQDISSIDESEAIGREFYIEVNPKATHDRYIVVHIYGYIAGIQYNDSHIYTITYQDGVTQYPVISSQRMVHRQAMPLRTIEKSDEEPVYEETHHGEDPSYIAEQEYISSDRDSLYEETEYNNESIDAAIDMEKEDSIHAEGDSITEAYGDSLAYEEHAPYQEEYDTLIESEASNEEKDTIAQKEHYNTIFTNDAIAGYAQEHELRVDHCICNGSIYPIEDSWYSRYGIVCVRADGTLEYTLQPAVEHGLLYTHVYDTFRCVVYDEEERSIDVDIAFEIYPIERGNAYRYIEYNTLPFPPEIRTLTVEGVLSDTEQTDCVLMIETYANAYMYTQDMHTVRICVLPHMQDVEEFLCNVVVYIVEPEKTPEERTITFTIEGYDEESYIADTRRFSVIPKEGQQYYYYTDFIPYDTETSYTNSNEEHALNTEITPMPYDDSSSHDAVYESYEGDEHAQSNISVDTAYDEYADNDASVFLRAQSIPQEHIFTVEDALMCKRISSKDIRLSGIAGDSVVLVGEGWDISNTPHKVYLQGCVYNTYGIHSHEGEYNVFIPDGVHVTYRER